MSNSKDDAVKKSGVILRTDVFYEPEYRELCLQQLNMYNETKMSSNYLKDLVETTHAFMKLMESMSKSKHLVVRSKKKRKAMPLKRTGQLSNGIDESNAKQSNEKVWDDISSKLSHALENNENTVSDISPFDPLSETQIDEQKLFAMIKIQDLLRQGNALQSIALLRSAREVWPEQETFGSEGADNEDDFMTLREILFAEIPRPRGLEPSFPETSDEPVDGNNLEPENELEEEYEEEYITYTSEQEFDFKTLASRFAVKSVCHAYALLFANYEKNSNYTNHCIIKMFHRISWDCALPSMLFSISIFRTFQKVHKEYQNNKISSLKELDRFAKYLLSKFFETCKTNKKVYMELFFWKNTREASEILEGYGTHQSSKSNKASFWTEDEEETLNRVFHQLKNAKIENISEDGANESDLLDSITAHFVSSGKSRRQVAKKLKAMDLIGDIKEVTRKPLKSKGKIWTSEEIDRLKILYEQFKDAIDPVARIKEQLSNQRTKRKIVEKILDLQLCSNPGDLKCKTGSRRRRREDMNNVQSESDSDSALEDSHSDSENSDSVEGAENNRSKMLLEILTNLPKNIKEALEWLKETFEENARDKNEEDIEHFPLLAVDEPIIQAIENDFFQKLLNFLKILSPSDSDVSYWSIQGKETIQSLNSKAIFIESLIAKVESSDNLELKDAENLLGLLKTQKPRKNKWMPIRKTLDPAAQARINAENMDNEEGNNTEVVNSKAKKRSSSVSSKRNHVSKCKSKKKNLRLENSNLRVSDSDSSADNGSEKTDNFEAVVNCSSPNNTQSCNKKKRNKRTISSDSSSDEEAIASNARIIKKDNIVDECDQQKSQLDSDNDSTVSTLKTKRRILDDSSSDEGVIDPYPLGEQRSFLQSSSPIRRHSTMTPSTFTPTSQTSRLDSPLSKRCRDSSSPISRHSTMTPSTLTPTSQTSRLNSPMSKRCRDSSSPQKGN